MYQGQGHLKVEYQGHIPPPPPEKKKKKKGGYRGNSVSQTQLFFFFFFFFFFFLNISGQIFRSQHTSCNSHLIPDLGTGKRLAGNNSATWAVFILALHFDINLQMVCKGNTKFSEVGKYMEIDEKPLKILRVKSSGIFISILFMSIPSIDFNADLRYVDHSCCQ